MNDELLDSREAQSGGSFNPNFKLDIGHVISRGFELTKREFLILLGVLLVFTVILIIGSLLVFWIPVVGSLAPGILAAVLFAGYYLGFKKIADNQEPSFNDFFGGFKFFGPVALYYIVYNLFVLAATIPFMIIIFTMFLPPDLLIEAATQEDPEAIVRHFQTEAFQSKVPAMMTVGLLAAIVSFIISLLYIITPPLIVNQELNFWQAMETGRKAVFKNFFSFVGLYIIIGLINMAGAIFFGLGLLFTVPLTMAVIYAVYESGLQSEPKV